MKPHLRAALAGLLLLAAPPALGSEGGADRDWTAVNRALVEGHLIPRYRLLAQETAILDTHVGRLRERPSETGLTLVRRAHVAALDAWSGISHVRFGPVETEQRWYRFQLWPDKRGTGQRQMRKLLAEGDPTLLEPQALARQSVAIQRLGALELLLFPEDQVGLPDLADAEGSSYRCRLAQAIGHNLAGMAGAILEDWTEADPPFRRVLLDPPATGQAGLGAAPPPFSDARALSAELLRTLATGVQVIHDLKLSEPLGQSAEGSQPRKAESWRSRRSLANVCTGLRALDHLYATGFSLVLRESRDTVSLDLDLGRGWAEAVAACLSLPGTLLDEAPSPEQRQALERLRGLALGLRARTGAPLAEALELSLGFNSLDGYEGPADEHPPLVAFQPPGQGLRLAEAPAEVRDQIWAAMRNYAGSVAADPSGDWFAVSAPRGNLVTFWDAGGSFRGSTSVADGCGLAPGDDAGSFYLTCGLGALHHHDCRSGATRRFTSPQTGTLQWDNHLRRCA